jgi:biotin carboxyl carrier protein
MAEIVMRAGDRRVRAQVTPSPGDGAGAQAVAVRVAGRDVQLRLERLGPTTWRVVDEQGAAHIVRSVEHAGVRWLHVGGETLPVRIGDAVARRPAARRPEGLEVPMPGTVTRVAVGEGETVTAGQPIVVVEAMKMEHVIRAPHAGRVVALRVRQGEQVEAGAVVAELQSAGAAPADATEHGP